MTEGPIPPKTWYIYVNVGHQPRTELVASPMIPAGTTPIVTYSSHPCGSPELPHCYIMIRMSSYDILGHGRIHFGELYDAFDGNGDCRVFVQEAPGVD